MRQWSTNSEIRSTAPPDSAWTIKTSSDKAATSSFLRRAVSLSARRDFSNRDSNNKRPQFSAVCHSLGSRIFARDLAKQIIIGCLPSRKMRKHSFSVGEWKPLTTVASSWENLRAALWALTIASSGQRPEQNKPILCLSKISRFPLIQSCAGAAVVNLSFSWRGQRGSDGTIVNTSEAFMFPWLTLLSGRPPLALIVWTWKPVDKRRQSTWRPANSAVSKVILWRGDD